MRHPVRGHQPHGDEVAQCADQIAVARDEGKAQPRDERERERIDVNNISRRVEGLDRRDGSFRPQNKITRAETMSLVNRMLNRKPETAEDLLENMTKWTDNADTNAWYYLAVQEATNSHYYEYKENSQYEKWTELRETRDWSELDK